VTGIREAASFEGLIVLAVIYFVLSRIQKVGSRGAQRGASPTERPPTPTAASKTQEGTALESILREIERVKQQGGRQTPSPPRKPASIVTSRSASVRLPPPRPEVVQDERGPLGRLSSTPLPSAEEVEDRTSLDDLRSRGKAESLGLTAADRQRRQRQVVDSDVEGAALAERRLQEAEARNRPHRAADHQAFDQRIRAGDAAAAGASQPSSERLRQAIVWREILGPPKAFEE
jgi:hypothetical protein